MFGSLYSIHKQQQQYIYRQNTKKLQEQLEKALNEKNLERARQIQKSINHMARLVERCS